MTNKEAIEQIKHIIDVSKTNERNEKEIDGYDEEALEIAIEALSESLTTGQHCGKCGKPDLTWETSRIPNHYTVLYGATEGTAGGCTVCTHARPVRPEPCEDAISRQAVLDLIEHYNSDGLGAVFYGYEEGEKFANAIKELPPVTQKPETVECDRIEEKSCSNCRFWCLDKNDENRRCQYCHNQDEWQAESEGQNERYIRYIDGCV